MRRVLPSLLIIAATTYLSAQEDDWSMNNKFNAYAEFLFWKRNLAPHGKVLAGNSVREHRELSAMMVSKKFDYAPGLGLGLMYQPSERKIFDFRFTMFETWNAHRTAAKTGELYYPFTMYEFLGGNTDWVNADQAQGKWNSKFYSAEVGYYHYLGPRRDNYFAFAWQVVPRYIYIPEKFKLSYTKEGSISNYKLNSSNHLWGIQLGSILEYNSVSTLYWQFGTKIGIFANSADQHQHMRDRGNTITLYNNHAEAYQCAMDVQLDLRLVYQIKSMLSAYLGYSYLYIWGIATAPGQARNIGVPNITGDVKIKDYVQYYGGTLGLSYGF